MTLLGWSRVNADVEERSFFGKIGHVHRTSSGWLALLDGNVIGTAPVPSLAKDLVEVEARARGWAPAGEPA